MNLTPACVLALLATVAQAGSFAPLRYDDDFSQPPQSADAYAQLKHIGLGEGAYASIGGDLRERFEYFDRSNIGARPADDYGLLMHRLLLHVDAHWDWLRAFVQLGNYEESGREPRAKPSDVDHLDIRQGFVDLAFPLGDDTLTLRGGRQELAFGASRLISARDGPNIRLAFDGAQLLYKSAQWRVTVLGVRPADNFPGRFDDSTDRSQSLWGAYATYRRAANLSTDFYYFGSANDDMRYDSVAGREHRGTFGLRIYGGASGFDADTELFFQNGDISGRTIRAFAWATDSGWTWREMKWQPRIGLRTDVISGDRDRNDGTLGTFNALYPTGSYFSEASVLAQANLIDFAASLTVRPAPQVSLAWSVNPLWRYSTEDALYTLPLAPLIAGDSSAARYIGTQNQLLATWQPNMWLSFKLALVKFESGRFVEKGGGHDLDYAQFATSARF